MQRGSRNPTIATSRQMPGANLMINVRQDALDEAAERKALRKWFRMLCPAFGKNYILYIIYILYIYIYYIYIYYIYIIYIYILYNIIYIYSFSDTYPKLLDPLRTTSIGICVTWVRISRVWMCRSTRWHGVCLKSWCKKRLAWTIAAMMWDTRWAKKWMRSCAMAVLFLPWNVEAQKKKCSVLWANKASKQHKATIQGKR